MMIAAHTVISCCSMTREQRQITPSSYKSGPTAAVRASQAALQTPSSKWTDLPLAKRANT